MALIEVENVSFKYPNGFKALDNISLEINAGESVAIVGQNGAGKTTAVKLLNGLLKPSEGQVLIDGWNTKEYTTAQVSRKVGYVFQNPGDQIFQNDVYSEVEFGPRKIGFNDQRVSELIDKASKLTQIDSYLKSNPLSLPFSTRKFVTIASVIAMDPEILIFDEPTAGQDLRGMKILSNLLNKLKSEGKTLITITHDMDFVTKNFDRVIVMANKKIIADDNKENIFWNHSILDEAMLKQPYISDLAYSLGINKKNILDVNDLVNFLAGKRSEDGENLYSR